MPFTDWSTGDILTATKLDNDNTVSVGTDTARTISVTHTWSAAQTFTGGWTAAAACTISAGGLTLVGGATVTGDSVITGTFGVTKTIRSTGVENPPSGSGIEVFYDAILGGKIVAYNRTGAAYLNAGIHGLTLDLNTDTAGAVKIGGTTYIGDNANAKATFGLTINQGAADDEIMAFKSSDVAHGVTDNTETDTFGAVYKAGAADGGLAIGGYTEGAIAMLVEAYATTVNTTKTTGGRGTIELTGYLKSGTGVTSLSADANVVVIRNLTTTRFIFDAEGSGHADVEWVAF
jgi:hypothetical protein